MTNTETCSNCGEQVPQRFSKVHDELKFKQETLPTAAKVTSVGGTPKEGAAIQNFVQINEGDKLVLRKDVEKLIEEKLKKQENRVQKFNGLDRLNLNDAKARTQELKQLLQQVKQ